MLKHGMNAVKRLKTYLINILGYELAAGVGPCINQGASLMSMLSCSCLFATHNQRDLKSSLLAWSGRSNTPVIWAVVQFQGQNRKHRLLVAKTDRNAQAARPLMFWTGQLFGKGCRNSWLLAFFSSDQLRSQLSFPRCLGNRAKHTYTYV